MRYLLTLCLMLCATGALAHPSHTSFAEISWSEDHSRLEVSLRVIPEDLEGDLQQIHGERVALQDTPQQRQWLTDWLANNFIIRDGTEQQIPALVGLELGYDATWIYFTATASPAAALTLDYRVLQGYNRERGRVQINTVQRLWAPAGDRMTYTESGAQLFWEPIDSPDNTS